MPSRFGIASLFRVLTFSELLILHKLASAQNTHSYVHIWNMWVYFSSLYGLFNTITLLLMQVSVRTTIGFAKEAPVLGIFGVNVYHKNRLIMVLFDRQL